MSSPNQRNRARRKDPFRRAVGAPAKRVQANPCPHGTCEHVAMAHVEVTDDQQPRAISVRCTRCDCREIRWPDEEAEVE